MAASRIKQVAIRNFTPCARKAPTDSKKQVQRIADSIKRFGFANPVLIEETHAILAGHGRVEAAKLMGMTDVPCVRLDHMKGLKSALRFRLITNWD